MEQATLGGGCFWCVEAQFLLLKGVEKVESGYAGGQTKNPTYKEIGGGRTGHAEVIQVTYDPEVLNYTDLLRMFFTAHDPTTLNRQGNDIGPQYRSIILYHDDSQRELAEKILAEVEAAKIWKNPIVTEIKPLDIFYVAEEYHQDYYARNPTAGYCQFVIAPKVNKFKKMYVDRLRK